MKLKNVEMIPGVIISEEDPDKLGRVKVAAPGLFDPETMDIDALPWIYPLMQFGYQGYAKMKDGQKVWVINNKKSYDEYWYVPFFELNEDTIRAIDQNEESDVVISRTITEDASVQIYYNKTEGIVLRIGDNKIRIQQNGDIYNESNGSVIKIEGKHVYTGLADGEFEPMILGDKLYDLLKTLQQDLSKLQQVAATNIYTMNLSTPLQQMVQNLNNFKEKIKSSNCSLN